MNLEHHCNYVVRNREECIFTYSSTDNRNSFNNLTSELLVFRLIELVEETNQELECFLEVGNEGFFGLFDCRCECCSCIFFYKRDSILNEKAQLLANELKVWQHYFLASSFHKVCKSCASM